MGNNSFKDLIDIGTFSLVRLFRNLTPPSGGCGPLVALGLDRIKRYGCRCSGQTVYTDARAYSILLYYGRQFILIRDLGFCPISPALSVSS